MKKKALLVCSILILFIPTTSFAWGLEIAGGAWYQEPSGDMSFDNTIDENGLDLKDDLNYDDKWKGFGRLIVDTPLFFPNVYLMYTPLKWDEAGRSDVNFSFGGQEFQADVDFDSELRLDHFDVAFFWSLPFVSTATADVLNIDIGPNLRMMDVKAEIKQKDFDIKESVSYFLPLPMLYTGVQINPLNCCALEFEGRGVAWKSNYYISLIGRVKVEPYAPFFVSGGYRYDKVKIDYDDLDIDARFQGPFVEAGLAF